MRLVRDVFIPFSAFPVSARSTVPALPFHFSAGRVNNEICPVPLFSGLHKQPKLLSRFSLNYTLFSGDHTEAVPGAGNDRPPGFGLLTRSCKNAVSISR